MSNIIATMSVLYRAIYDDPMDPFSYLVLADAIEEMGLGRQESSVPYYRAMAACLQGDRRFFVHPDGYPSFIRPLCSSLRTTCRPVTVHVTDCHVTEPVDSWRVYHTYEPLYRTASPGPLVSEAQVTFRSYSSIILVEQTDVLDPLCNIVAYMHPGTYVEFVLNICQN